MDKLNIQLIEQTSKQLRRIQMSYILTFIVGGVLLIPLVGMLFSLMMGCALFSGLLIYTYTEMRKHYRDSLLGIAIGLAIVSFGVNIIQIKLFVIQGDVQTLIAIFMGVVTYLMIVTAYILLGMSFSQFREERKQFKMMISGEQYKRFKIQPAMVEHYGSHAHTGVDRRPLLSFFTRATLVIAIYFVVMNSSIVIGVIVIPFRIILSFLKDYVAMDEQTFSFFARAWLNVYLQVLFAIAFIGLFFKEIKQALKRLKWSHSAFIFGGYATSILMSRLITFLLDLFQISIPQSANQTSLMEMQKIAPLALIITAVLLAPITEELVFRQGIAEMIYQMANKMFKLDIKWMKDIIIVFSIVVSGFLFGLVHVLDNGDYIAMIPYVVSGVVYTCFYFVSGRNTTVTIGIHMLNNLIATIITL